MYVVYYYENKNQLLNQLLKRVPTVGENLTIKGRKAKVTRVNSIDERKFQVQVTLEPIQKAKISLEDLKKRRR
ncbi:hypothetical protein [Peribacillus alkalitolerans]|uniref:hypothetical protein n=1 Tax=Peribacillus alkalitolerans TaxID=1550385 RepID=UPI0013D2E787|nr:hypothetical protein [Peribacillus alkalitolerans]